MTSWSRSSTGPGRGPLLASVAVHAVVALVAWYAHRAAFQPFEYVAYEMQMISVAEMEALEELAFAEPDLVVETPEDPEPPLPEPEVETPPPLPEPEPEVTPEPAPEPRPERPEPEPEPPPRPVEPAPEAPRPQPTVEPERPAEASTADIMARMEGLQRDFPAYYQRIQTEIARCFRPPPGVERATTILRFQISRDGTVQGGSIRVHQRSGNTRFDMAALGAVECAGAGRFGPLPDEISGGMLPVQFTFSPVGFRE
jgi:periplasmic protein TonB